ncbi:hypothetical protein SK128_019363 [Halocaridina rubra]|uniref:Uncharacterized protein n=1 Tax=Halocaridina rubra TaxID=373956 RepID=A0AAN8ZTV6_HALRR
MLRRHITRCVSLSITILLAISLACVCEEPVTSGSHELTTWSVFASILESEPRSGTGEETEEKESLFAVNRALSSETGDLENSLQAKLSSDIQSKPGTAGSLVKDPISKLVDDLKKYSPSQIFNLQMEKSLSEDTFDDCETSLPDIASDIIDTFSSPRQSTTKISRLVTGSKYPNITHEVLYTSSSPRMSTTGIPRHVTVAKSEYPNITRKVIHTSSSTHKTTTDIPRHVTVAKSEYPSITRKVIHTSSTHKTTTDIPVTVAKSEYPNITRKALNTSSTTHQTTTEIPRHVTVAKSEYPDITTLEIISTDIPATPVPIFKEFIDQIENQYSLFLPEDPNMLVYGDMVLSSDQENSIFGNSSTVLRRTATQRLWPTEYKFPTVPYHISLEEEDKNFLNFIKGEGCWSYIGFTGEMKPQNISLGTGCYAVCYCYLAVGGIVQVTLKLLVVTQLL